MIILLFSEDGLEAIRLPERLDAETLLRHRRLLDALAPSLQRLDAEIKSLGDRDGNH